MQERKVQYKYVYRDLLDNSKSRIVTAMNQLAELTMLNSRTITNMFSKSDIHYHKHGMYVIERMVYLKSERKRR